MRGLSWRFLAVLAVCSAGIGYWASSAVSVPGAAHRSAARRALPDRPSAWEIDARRAARELIGSGDSSPVGFDWKIAEWGGLVGPHWWQSALAVIALIHYAERTGYRGADLQHVLDYLYKRNIYKPWTDEKREFANQYMDDTAWWGIAWMMASEYELYDRENAHDARRFLRVAEWDARYVASKRRCGGIEWELGSPPGTITEAEYIALTAGLAQYRRAPSMFYDPGLASRWLSDAQGSLRWLEHRGLVNVRLGQIRDRYATRACHKMVGGPLAYSEGEMADALVQLGRATGQSSYYTEARRFLRYVLDPAHGFVLHGVLHEHCEAQHLCIHLPNRYDITAFKGIFVQAVSDYAHTTGSRRFDGFLRAQARAVLRNAMTGITTRRKVCPGAHACQFAFSWTVPVTRTPAREKLVTVGTQESALDALTAVVPSGI